MLRFVKKITPVAALLIFASGAFGQQLSEFESIVEGEKAAWLRLHAVAEGGMQNSADNRSDITYCRYHFWVDPAVNYIRGEITTVFEPVESVDSLLFDFSSALTMDSILYHGAKLSFASNGNILAVYFPNTLPAFLPDSLAFYYQGVPGSSGFGSFITNTHNGVPVMWTLSQPYGSMEWMPCKHSLTDKIDSVDIYVTHPDGYRAASNGVLVSETLAGGQKTTHWKSRYPIAAYLVAFAVTNYEVFTDEVAHADGNTPIVNYVYPETMATAQASMPNLTAQMQLFNDLFGLYPFHEEKYGHAQFGWGGGMEHQTMSFMGGFGYELMAHELAHQWFGNKVTCGSWADIWLNEGFATYLSGLCYQYLAPQFWQQFKQQRINNVTSQPGGSMFVDDTTNVSRIFSGRLSYAKGAMVLHMLRWICGDSAFFGGIRNYLNDPQLAFGYARTPDLQAHLEAASGKNLQGFFDDWYLGQGYPSYDIVWSQDDQKLLSFEVKQTQSHPSVAYFELPLPLRLKGAQGQVKDIVLDHSFEGQIFQHQADFVVASVEFDPELWLITKGNSVAQGTVGAKGLAALNFWMSVEPNPVTGGVLQAVVNAPFSCQAFFSIDNMEGRTMFSRMQGLVSGENRLSFERLGCLPGCIC